MKVVELLKIGGELLKLLSKTDSNMQDWRYIELYDEFVMMKKRRMKVRAIARELSEKYSIGVSTVYKIVKRLSRDC